MAKKKVLKKGIDLSNDKIENRLLRHEEEIKQLYELFFIKNHPMVANNNEVAVDVKPANLLKDFEDVIESRINKTRELILVKGKEYVRGEDRFHNFKRAAEMNRTTPTRALHGMLTKHLVSVMDILDDLDKGILPSEAAVSEKFGDVIVYTLLQEALIMQTIKSKKV